LTEYALNYFNREEYEIIASGRRQTDFFMKKGIEYYSVDLTNDQDFDKLPCENVHAVMLLSAQIPSYMAKYQPKKYAVNELGYKPQYNCRQLFEDYKREMELNKYQELRMLDI